MRKSALEVTPGEWDEVMTVNLTGTFFMCQQMGRHLVAKRKPGSIVNISSTHGLVGFPQRSAYGISKAGILHATRMLALEWAGHGIRVNAIAPGTIETPTRAEYFKAEPEAREAMLARVPLHRFARPEDGAAAVFFGFVFLEVIVLIVNGMRCPLTGVAARYTDDRRDNFDIFLPEWIARHNKFIFGTLYLLGSLYAFARWSDWL